VGDVDGVLVQRHEALPGIATSKLETGAAVALRDLFPELGAVEVPRDRLETMGAAGDVVEELSEATNARDQRTEASMRDDVGETSDELGVLVGETMETAVADGELSESRLAHAGGEELDREELQASFASSFVCMASILPKRGHGEAANKTNLVRVLSILATKGKEAFK
jgi:hypothetical protein